MGLFAHQANSRCARKSFAHPTRATNQQQRHKLNLTRLAHRQLKPPKQQTTLH
jgi:hypothetical protein